MDKKLEPNRLRNKISALPSHTLFISINALRILTVQTKPCKNIDLCKALLL